MNIKELFKGIAVVIDDQVNKTESDDSILKIIERLENENIPLLKYEYIPDDDIIKNFHNVSFVLLDWELFDRPKGVSFDDQLHIDNVIEFLIKLKEVSFVPVFIFSRLPPDDIKNLLVKRNLFKEGASNYIFIKRKSDLLSDDEENKLFNEIENWLKQTPSIYVLKEWENALNKAKNNLFWDFYNINHKWPSILQKTFTEDGSDVNYELGNFIFKNIMARTEPIEFDEDILKLEDNELTQDEIRKVLEAERFIKSDLLPDNPFSGDLFALHYYEIYKDSKKEKLKFFINIRPDCDIIRDKDSVKKGQKKLKSDNPDYNPELYCLECELIKNIELHNNGAIIERNDSSIIPFVYDGKILKVRFDKIHIFKWKQSLMKKGETNKRIFKEARVGRVLPPYITAIQQKYAFYLQRQGLPAIPRKAIKDD